MATIHDHLRNNLIPDGDALDRCLNGEAPMEEILLYGRVALTAIAACKGYSPANFGVLAFQKAEKEGSQDPSHWGFIAMLCNQDPNFHANAIHALQRSLEIDPTPLPVWEALEEMVHNYKHRFTREWLEKYRRWHAELAQKPRSPDQPSWLVVPGEGVSRRKRSTENQSAPCKGTCFGDEAGGAAVEVAAPIEVDAVAPASDGGGAESCVICCGDIQCLMLGPALEAGVQPAEDDQREARLPCDHHFHLGCINACAQRVSNQCPACRAKFNVISYGPDFKYTLSVEDKEQEVDHDEEENDEQVAHELQEEEAPRDSDNEFIDDSDAESVGSEDEEYVEENGSVGSGDDATEETDEDGDEETDEVGQLEASLTDLSAVEDHRRVRSAPERYEPVERKEVRVPSGALPRPPSPHSQEVPKSHGAIVQGLSPTRRPGASNKRGCPDGEHARRGPAKPL